MEPPPGDNSWLEMEYIRDAPGWGLILGPVLLFLVGLPILWWLLS